MKWFRSVSALLVFLLPSLSYAADHVLLIADETSPVVQNARADDDNLSRMANTEMLRRFALSGYLVPVPASTGDYYLQRVPAAYRYSRPWTKLFLARLSQQFRARFHHRLRVTSLVRTASRQRKLARSNANAADASGPQRSSHLTGATIDISKRFMSAQERDWMRTVLYSLRQQGYLYAIEEFYQPTFHVMVYRNYPQYVRLLERRAEKSERLEAEDRQQPNSEEISDEAAEPSSQKVTP